MKNYYLLSNGRLSRRDNTLYVENAASGEKKPIPVEDVDSLYLYGEVDLNTKVLNFLSQKRIPLHVFNYYGFYSGSYYPREFLNSGYLVVQQARHYSDPLCRMPIARELVRASAHSLLRNVAYYSRRRDSSGGPEEEMDRGAEIGVPPAAEQNSPNGADPRGPAGAASDRAPAPRTSRHRSDQSSSQAAGQRSGQPADEVLEAAVDRGLSADYLDDGLESDPDGMLPGTAAGSSDADGAEATDEQLLSLEALRESIEHLAGQVTRCEDVAQLLGVEGKMRNEYYHCWKHILADGWEFARRVRRPPDNEVNALISFGNGVLYTVCLAEIYRTQLHPTISYLHQPGARRFSLALDLSEIFKPLIVDRTIFRLINTRRLEARHFSKDMESCYLSEEGKRLFLGALEERLGATIRHRRLGRHVSYRHLIRLECYKLIRHLTGVEPYRAFRAWW